jgi:hypothetical protein
LRVSSNLIRKHYTMLERPVRNELCKPQRKKFCEYSPWVFAMVAQRAYAFKLLYE